MRRAFKIISPRVFPTEGRLSAPAWTKGWPLFSHSFAWRKAFLPLGPNPFPVISLSLFEGQQDQSSRLHHSLEQIGCPRAGNVVPADLPLTWATHFRFLQLLRDLLSCSSFSPSYCLVYQVRWHLSHTWLKQRSTLSTACDVPAQQHRLSERNREYLPMTLGMHAG